MRVVGDGMENPWNEREAMEEWKDCPHRMDILGWRREIRRRGIEWAETMGNIRSCWGILAGAKLGGCSIRVKLTGGVSPRQAKQLARRGRWVTEFTGPGEYVRRMLRQAGISGEKVKVEEPMVILNAVSEERRREVRQRLLGGAKGPLLICAEGPWNREAVKCAAWAAGILRYLYPELALAICGMWEKDLKDAVKRWEAQWGVAGLYRLAGEECRWEEAMQAGDLVISGDEWGAEWMRWKLVCQANVPVGYVPGAVRDLLGERENCRMAKGTRPRYLAVAAESLMPRCAARP